MIRHFELRVTGAAHEVGYWCVNGHCTPRMWSAAVPVPERWQCRYCGLPAGRDSAHPPAPVAAAPFKTPLAYLFERRSEADCEALLAEALEGLHARRRNDGRGRPQGSRS